MPEIVWDKIIMATYRLSKNILHAASIHLTVILRTRVVYSE